jgi:hypothetical protein
MALLVDGWIRAALQRSECSNAEMGLRLSPNTELHLRQRMIDGGSYAGQSVGPVAFPISLGPCRRIVVRRDEQIFSRKDRAAVCER